MKSVFSAGQWQKHLVEKIQNPAKEVLNRIAIGKFTLQDANTALEILRDLSALPEPTRENTQDHNSLIAIDIRDDFFKHLNIGESYVNIFQLAINYVIAKYGYDNFYKGAGDWWLGEMLRRGWQLPGQNRPSSELWYTITPATRERLAQSIKDNYNLLRQRVDEISEKLGDSKEGQEHKQSRFEQFINRILTDFEREVVAWK